MIRWRQSVSAESCIDVLLAAMALGHEASGASTDADLSLHVEVGRAVEVAMQLRATAQTAEEAHSRRLEEYKAQIVSQWIGIVGLCFWTGWSEA